MTHSLRQVPPQPRDVSLGKDELVIIGETGLDGPPKGKDWLHEIKVDGWRVALLTDGRGGLRLQTKSGTDRTWDFVSPVKEIASCGRRLVLDGEIAVPDTHGVTKIDTLHQAMRARKTDGLIYFAFDILHFDGQDLRAWPIEKRKRALCDLNQLIKLPDRLMLVDGIVGNKGEWLFNMAEQCGAEGIVSKKLGTPYVGGSKPSKEWLKSICNPA